MIFGTLNSEKVDINILQICRPHLSDVATLTWEIPQKVIIYVISEKKTVAHLPTPPENVTTQTCEMQKFFI